MPLYLYGILRGYNVFTVFSSFTNGIFPHILGHAHSYTTGVGAHSLPPYNLEIGLPKKYNLDFGLPEPPLRYPSGITKGLRPFPSSRVGVGRGELRSSEASFQSSAPKFTEVASFSDAAATPLPVRARVMLAPRNRLPFGDLKVAPPTIDSY